MLPRCCCVHCQADEFEAAEVSGRGVIYSYSIVDRRLHAGFVDTVPYTVVLIELADQPELRILTNLVEVTDGTSLSCVVPVEVVFEDRGGVTLPQLRLSESS